MKAFELIICNERKPSYIHLIRFAKSLIANLIWNNFDNLGALTISGKMISFSHFEILNFDNFSNYKCAQSLLIFNISNKREIKFFWTLFCTYVLLYLICFYMYIGFCLKKYISEKYQREKMTFSNMFEKCSFTVKTFALLWKKFSRFFLTSKLLARERGESNTEK